MPKEERAQSMGDEIGIESGDMAILRSNIERKENTWKIIR